MSVSLRSLYESGAASSGRRLAAGRLRGLDSDPAACKPSPLRGRARSSGKGLPRPRSGDGAKNAGSCPPQLASRWRPAFPPASPSPACRHHRRRAGRPDRALPAPQERGGAAAAARSLLTRTGRPAVRQGGRVGFYRGGLGMSCTAACARDGLSCGRRFVLRAQRPARGGRGTALCARLPSRARPSGLVAGASLRLQGCPPRRRRRHAVWRRMRGGEPPRLVLPVAHVRSPQGSGMRADWAGRPVLASCCGTSAGRSRPTRIPPLGGKILPFPLSGRDWV